MDDYLWGPIYCDYFAKLDRLEFLARRYAWFQKFYSKSSLQGERGKKVSAKTEETSGTDRKSRRPAGLRPHD